MANLFKIHCELRYYLEFDKLEFKELHILSVYFDFCKCIVDDGFFCNDRWPLEVACLPREVEADDLTRKTYPWPWQRPVDDRVGRDDNQLKVSTDTQAFICLRACICISIIQWLNYTRYFKVSPAIARLPQNRLPSQPQSSSPSKNIVPSVKRTPGFF